MNKKLHSALTVGLAAVFVVSAGMAVRQRLDDRGRTESYETAIQYAGLSLPETKAEAAAKDVTESQTGSSDKASANQTTDPSAEMKEPVDLIAESLEQIDLETLQAVNPEVIGWICIPDTVISYPLLRGEDNDFYLKHTWDRASHSGGSIFMDWRSSADLTDFNTIIYGHRMRDGSMFGALKHYKDREFWGEHPSVYITDENGVHVYDIFAAWEPSTKSIVYTLDFDSDETRQRFLDTCTKGSWLDPGVTLNRDSRILTLSTCTGRGHATRWVVQGYLAREYASDSK